MLNASKRVLHLTGMHCTKFGSFERYLLEVASECRNRGYSSVLQYESAPLPIEYSSALAEIGATVVTLPTATRNVQTVRNVWCTLRDVRPDVINSHFTERYALLTAALVAPHFGVRRVVSTVHGVHHLGTRSLARYAYNQCDYILPVSRGAATDLQRGHVKREIIHTHHLGLFGQRHLSAARRAEIREALAIPPNALVLGNIAFDAPVKGVDALIRALPAIIQSHPSVILMQVGIDPAASQLPSLVSELGVADAVTWVGIRDRGYEYLQAADVYVQPSQSDEGLPLSIMEAMELGLPVLATDVVGNSEAVVDDVTGRLVSAGSPRFLADGLIDLIRQSNRWSEMGLAGRARFEAMFQGLDSVAKLVTKYYGISDDMTARASFHRVH